MMPPKRRRDSRRKNREDLEQILMLGFLCEEKLKIIKFKEKRKNRERDKRMGLALAFNRV